MKGVDQFPVLNTDILKRIVQDGVQRFEGIEKIGLVGSFARGTHGHTSDVDLLLKTAQGHSANEVLEAFGLFVAHVLDYQFNKRLDIVKYELAQKRATTPPAKGAWYHQEGYQNMLKEVVWLYERPNYFAEN